MNEVPTYIRAASYLRERLAVEFGDNDVGMTRPSVGIICGSGLSGLSDALDTNSSGSSNSSSMLKVSYGEIPGFPNHCTVPGHKGEIVFGRFPRGGSTSSSDNNNNVVVACFRGRFHSYEGYDGSTIVLPVRVMRCLGIKIVIVTNAAGGLANSNSVLRVGDLICVNDHVALPHLTGSISNPLMGPNHELLGPRFSATSNAYDPSLRRIAVASSKEIMLDDDSIHVVPKGTYCFVSGPMYESRAEGRFLKSLGGDVVGMSTVPEVVAAHHCGMKVLCLSLVTNMVLLDNDDNDIDIEIDNDTEKAAAAAANHAEVLREVSKKSKQLQYLVQRIVQKMGTDILPHLPDLKSIPLPLLPSPPATYSDKNTATTALAEKNLAARILFFQGVVVGAYTSTWLFSTLLGIGWLVKSGGSVSSFFGRKK